MINRFLINLRSSAGFDTQHTDAETAPSLVFMRASSDRFGKIGELLSFREDSLEPEVAVADQVAHVTVTVE